MEFNFGYNNKVAPNTGATPLSEYISNGEINVLKKEWELLNRKYSKEELIEFLVTEVYDNKQITLPMKRLTEKDAIDAFNYALNYECNPIFEDKTYTKFDYNYSLSNRYIYESNKANDASNYFQQYNRMCCEHVAIPSPVRVWNTRKFLTTLFPALWSMKFEEVNTGVLLNIIALRKYVASQFNPLIAKSIYTKFNAKNIIDFSSGWGDRLCGFYATPTTESYIGIDPNTHVYNNYFKQIALYKKLTKEKKVTLYNLPAEEVELDENIADTIFTSPPYFNMEKYSTEATQSCNRYKTCDAWLSGFMIPTLNTMWRALKKEGHLIINISDSAQGGKQKRVCDAMNDHIKSLGGTYVEGLGMKMSKRPNSMYHKDDNGDKKEGTFIEPIWVWKK